MQQRNRYPNGIATYKCRKGYHLIGQSERVCQLDGQWSGSVPICEGLKALHLKA